MTNVTLHHINKQFAHTSADAKPITALKDISFKLLSGDILGVLGPSGCGKSTLLRIIAGLMEPDSGDVYYNQTRLKDVPMTERGIGMVFQEGALVPHWVARESVSLFLKLRKREREVPERVRRISKITGFGLDVLMERRPGQLSGGEKQRISIARALTRDMRVLLFDEPFANLDAKMRHEARIELKRLLYEFPVTSVYVTHDQVEAVGLSHRIAVMREGRMEQIGTYEQLYSSPINMFVAQFVGTPSINLFKGKVEDGRWQGDNFGGYPVRHDLPNGMPVTMGIRPEYVHLAEGGTPSVVNTVIPFLPERYQLLEVWLDKERWSITVPLDQRIERGATVYCAPDSSAMLFFDTRTGLRIG